MGSHVAEPGVSTVPADPPPRDGLRRRELALLVVPQPLARSAGGLTLLLSGRTRWAGDADRNRHLTGADIGIRIASPRRRVDGEVSISSSNNFQ